jgi:CxxC motif-containing protein (DUF1111 family)
MAACLSCRMPWATRRFIPNKLRTAPLWGVRMKARFMHDLASPTLEDAIERHAGEARHVTRRFEKLTANEKQQLITFLKSL